MLEQFNWPCQVDGARLSLRVLYNFFDGLVGRSPCTSTVPGADFGLHRSLYQQIRLYTVKCIVRQRSCAFTYLTRRTSVPCATVLVVSCYDNREEWITWMTRFDIMPTLKKQRHQWFLQDQDGKQLAHLGGYTIIVAICGYCRPMIDQSVIKPNNRGTITVDDLTETPS